MIGHEQFYPVLSNSKAVTSQQVQMEWFWNFMGLVIVSSNSQTKQINFSTTSKRVRHVNEVTLIKLFNMTLQWSLTVHFRSYYWTIVAHYLVIINYPGDAHLNVVMRFLIWDLARFRH